MPPAPHQPASPWKRLLAFAFDLPVLLIAGFAARAISEQLAGAEYLVGWIYFAAMESSALQATFGKKLLSMKVADAEGNRVGFGKASYRYLLKLVTVISLGAGFAMAFFTEKRQAFHDYISGCIVWDTGTIKKGGE